MASILKRGPYQFQATIRLKGFPSQSRTFETKRVFGSDHEFSLISESQGQMDSTQQPVLAARASVFP